MRDAEKAKSLFLAAIERHPSGVCATFLDDACGGDIALRDRVEQLLEAHRALGTMPSPAAATLDHPAADRPGTAIGPYKLLEEIGEGGMGQVFMAEQTAPVRRKVALKLIRPGMDSRQVIARFEAERQALAMMDHPNIARVLDAGATENGRPYFVMELVKGIPITDYCDRERLPVRGRLELFVLICRAVQHAHQKGIIHRDIKPSNVLITLHDGVPVPKVIDFGIAKATGPSLTDKTLYTGFAQLVGTPLYMSPEQAAISGLDVDTRSDIYSLGVLLYELLTGTTPFDGETLRNAAFDEMRRIIREEEPQKPSTRLSSLGETLSTVSAKRGADSRRLNRAVCGDLDWVVMRALEKDRRRRYETANDFAADVMRHLTDQPVEACPPSRTYRLRKFARKHCAALATAGAFVLLLTAATAISSGLAYRATHAERLARQRLTRAETAEAEAKTQAASARTQQKRAEDREVQAIDAVKRFRDAVADEPELKNHPGLEALRKRLLKEPLAFFRALRDRLQADRGTRSESLARLAEASFELGKLTIEIGDKQDALIAYRETLALTKELAAAKPTVTGYQIDLALTHNHLGFLLQSAIGKPDEAMEAYESALAILRKLAPAYATDTEFLGCLASTHNNIGELLRATGKPAEALEAHESALAIRQKLADAHPSDTGFRRNLAISHHNIGVLLHATARPAEALKAYESALAILQTLADANPGDIESQYLLAASHFGIGELLRTTGKPAEALEAFESALAIQRKLAAAHPSDTELQSHLASSHNSIAILMNESGKPAEALEAYESALAIQRKLALGNPTDIRFQRGLAGSHSNIGCLLNATGKPAEALQAFESAVAIQKKLVRDHPESPDFASGLGGILNNLARLDLDARRFAEARGRLRQAVEWQNKALDANPVNPTYRQFLANHLTNLIQAARGLGDSEGVAEAERELAKLREETLAFQKVKLGADHPDTLTSMWHLAESLARLDRGAEAVSTIDQCLELAVGKAVSPQLFPGLIDLRLRYFEKSKDVAGCRATAEMWERLNPTGPDNLYNAACFRAVVASVVRAADHSPECAKLASAEADRAMDWLAKAVAAGYGDVAHMKQDTDLDALRDRADFKKLMAELEARAGTKK